jgi:hypothetical protein
MVHVYIMMRVNHTTCGGRRAVLQVVQMSPQAGELAAVGSRQLLVLVAAASTTMAQQGCPRHHLLEAAAAADR